jgi:hypothetical protein
MESILNEVTAPLRGLLTHSRTDPALAALMTVNVLGPAWLGALTVAALVGAAAALAAVALILIPVTVTVPAVAYRRAVRNRAANQAQ